ncbi:MFS transporter [Streptomyces zaomyceticus]|uniref:MFS transporter n=1 Tax=Streptomyces zaomyceticus TaxID=68286 RepID=UPI001678785A|nr:MFS transporter [Streptomyces zaomyceticus]GHG20580.1 MFS transporter [Streptomyces zaomyceticus]
MSDVQLAKGRKSGRRESDGGRRENDGGRRESVPDAGNGHRAVAAVALGVFTVMTAELLPVGLLTPAAADLSVSEGAAALMVTVPGLVAALAAPLVTARAAGADRRALLVALLLLAAVAHLVSALAGHLGTVLAARVLLGIAIGGFWALAGGLAPRLVPAGAVGRATAVIFGGVSAASVIGVPAGTLLTERMGWRWAFAATGVLALLAAAALRALLPRLPGTGTGGGSGAGAEAGSGAGSGADGGAGTRSRTGPAALLAMPRRNRRVRAGLLLTLALVTGHFLAYSFVRPLLTDHSGISGSLLGALLLGYGVAGVAGNFLAGPRAARSPGRTLAVLAVALGAVLLAGFLLGDSAATGAVLLLLWGLAYGGVPVALQSWFMAAAPDDVETATGLNVSVFCLAIALGALLGGLLADAYSLTAVLLAGAALTLAACPVAALSGRNDQS